VATDQSWTDLLSQNGNVRCGRWNFLLVGRAGDIVREHPGCVRVRDGHNRDWLCPLVPGAYHSKGELETSVMRA
jgi:hypothetical protein